MNKQILIRVGTGLTAFGALIWLLWPEDFSSFPDPEPLFVFLGAFFVWIYNEFIQVTPEKTFEPKERLGKNDTRVARQLLSYHQHIFREFLQEQDLGGYFSYRYSKELHALNHASMTNQFEFLNPELQENWLEISMSLRKFGLFLAVNTTPQAIRGNSMVRLDYNTSSRETADTVEQPSKAETGNEMASEIWNKFDLFVKKLKVRFPELLDEVIEYEWFFVTNE